MAERILAVCGDWLGIVNNYEEKSVYAIVLLPHSDHCLLGSGTHSAGRIHWKSQAAPDHFTTVFSTLLN